MCVREFRVERDVAAKIACGKGQNDKMALGLALSITEDDLAIARECERLDGEPGFFFNDMFTNIYLSLDADHQWWK